MKFLIFFALLFSVNVQAQYYPIYPIAPVYPAPVYPVYPVRSPVCQAYATCYNGLRVTCEAFSGFAIGINGPDCSWRANYNFVSCTGFLRGPYGWYWGTETRFCY